MSNYWNLPLPNEIIDLKEIHKIKFYNISFREYVGIYDKYIIGVYPFSIKIDNALIDGVPISYEDFKLYGVKSAHHHNDFVNHEIDVDPCDVYEIVSGKKIHHGESDSMNMNMDHTDDIKLFNAEILSTFRERKLKTILS